MTFQLLLRLCYSIIVHYHYVRLPNFMVCLFCPQSTSAYREHITFRMGSLHLLGCFIFLPRKDTQVKTNNFLRFSSKIIVHDEGNGRHSPSLPSPSSGFEHYVLLKLKEEECESSQIIKKKLRQPPVSLILKS